MTLSDKRNLDNEVPRCFYWEEDVKESLTIIRERLLIEDWEDDLDVIQIIDEEMGAKLK